VTTLVRLDRVSKDYTEGGLTRSVLREASATLAEGEFVVVRGRSGCGKTTLLNLVAGIDQPTSGDVLIEGRSLPALTERERTIFRRNHIGIVFQFFNLIPTLTVAENVRLPGELAPGHARDARAAARDLLDRVGLADRAGDFPDRLSGGEQQRVAIARALVHNPRIVLADEPTGNLDDATGESVLDLLDDLTRRSGRCLLLATHSEQVAERADRVLTIEAGHLVPAGAVSDT
jgi:putative ABC transport system ATP-binding protein